MENGVIPETGNRGEGASLAGKRTIQARTCQVKGEYRREGSQKTGNTFSKVRSKVWPGEGLG